jgi:antitoxin (DNA-binding transcriptional repressor) of toxin-antitoxin stability system
MRAVGVKELKARLSEYLRAVKAGEVILVTDRDEVVAELRQARPLPPPSEPEDTLQLLAEAGEVTRARQSKGQGSWRARGLGLPPGPAQGLLDELRADRDLG